jgi:nitrite reductase/ring-hydroxylating ferredoxin subunit
MPEFKVADAGDVPAGQGRTIKVEGKQIALFNVSGEFYAIDDGCPHMRANLSCGVVKELTVLCGWHGWEFDLQTGDCLNVGWAKVGRYDVAVRDEEIFLTIEPEPDPDDEEEELPEIVWKNRAD